MVWYFTRPLLSMRRGGRRQTSFDYGFEPKLAIYGRDYTVQYIYGIDSCAMVLEDKSITHSDSHRIFSS